MYGDDATVDHDDTMQESKSVPSKPYKHTGVHFVDASMPTQSNTESNILHTVAAEYAPPSPEITSGNVVIKGAFVPGIGYMQSGDHAESIHAIHSQNKQQIDSVPTQLLPPTQPHTVNVTDELKQEPKTHKSHIQASTSTTDIDTYKQTTEHKHPKSLSDKSITRDTTDSNGEPTFRAWVAESPDGKWARYDKKLGSGTFKEVYLSVDTESGKEVAWNIVDLRRLTAADIKRIRSETDLLTKLRHPHIIEIYDVFELVDSKQLCFITEKMSYTLKQHIANLHPAKTKVIKKYCRQILRALAYLHSFTPPIIHRDLKCDNIFIDGTTGDAKLGDFGLAIHQYSATSMIGTPGFMAPELFNDKYNELVDIWSFGMCVFEMITNEFPYIECNGVVSVLLRKGYEGILPNNINKIKDNNIREFIMMCLQPANKRPSATQLLQNTIFDLSEPVPTVRPTDATADNTTNINTLQQSDTNTTNTDNASNSAQSVDTSNVSTTMMPEPSTITREASGTGNVSDTTTVTQTAAALKLAEDEAHRLENKRRAEQLITKVDVVKTDNPAVVSISLHCLLPKQTTPVNTQPNTTTDIVATDIQSNTVLVSSDTSPTNITTPTATIHTTPASLPIEFEHKQILIPSYDFSKDNYITVATQLVKTMNELKALEIDHLEEFIAQRIETSTKRYYDKWSTKHRSTQNSEIMTLLSSLGINLSYATKFIEQEVSIDDLFLLNDTDLTEFLPKLGPRRRMQQYLDTEREKRKLDTKGIDTPTNEVITETTQQPILTPLTTAQQQLTVDNTVPVLQYYSDVPAADKLRRRKSSVDETETERVVEREKRKLKQKYKHNILDSNVTVPTNSDDDKKLRKLINKPIEVQIVPQQSPTNIQQSNKTIEPVNVAVQPTVLDTNDSDELLYKREKQKLKQLTQKREQQRIEKLMNEMKRNTKSKKNGYEESEEQSDESHREHDSSDSSAESQNSDDDIQSTAHMLSANMLLRKRLHKARQVQRQLDNITEEHSEQKHNQLEHAGSMPDLNRQCTPDGSIQQYTSAPVSPSHRTVPQPVISTSRPTLHVSTPTRQHTQSNTTSPIVNSVQSPGSKQTNSTKPVIVQPIRKNSDTTTAPSKIYSTGNVSPSNKSTIIQQSNKQIDDGGMTALLSKITTELGSKPTTQPPPSSPRMHPTQRRNSDLTSNYVQQPSPYTSQPVSNTIRQSNMYDTAAPQPSQQRAYSAIPIQPTQPLSDLSLTRSMSQTKSDLLEATIQQPKSRSIRSNTNV